MENPPFWWYLLGKMGIFMGYVSFREGKNVDFQCSKHILPKWCCKMVMNSMVQSLKKSPNKNKPPSWIYLAPISSHHNSLPPSCMVYLSHWRWGQHDLSKMLDPIKSITHGNLRVPPPSPPTGKKQRPYNLGGIFKGLGVSTPMVL